MRLISVASLILCGLLCTGCESLNKTARGWSRKDPTAEQLAKDQQRREAAEKQVADKSPPPAPAGKIGQQTNFAPDTTAKKDSPDNTLLRAKQAEQARQNQVAKSLYEQVLQQQPQNAEAHHRLGVLADQDGRYNDAQEHYKAALLQQPQNASLLSDVGYSFYSQDRLNEAEQYLQQALRVQPDNQYARNNLAQVYGRRAVQTGSATDYQLAKEQFTLALGPQGAEQQMQQLFPQSGSNAADRKGFPNPFKKIGQDKTVARNGSSLQAPPLNGKNEDGNAAFARLLEQTRKQMEDNGQLPRPRPTAPVAGGPANVPLDRVNNELARIDAQALRQQEAALRQNNPARPRGTNPQGDWSSLQQTGGWNQQTPNSQPRSFADGSFAGGDNGFQSSMPNVRSGGSDWDQSGSAGNGQYSDSSQGQVQRANGTENTVPGWEQESAGTGLSTSWPIADSSATQFDARGQSWNGQRMMQSPAMGAGPNQTYEANDPTYTVRQGSTFGAQRPTQQRGRNYPGGRAGSPGGWDDGRQTAAQLGLDAGMGDMFPGGPGDADFNGGDNSLNWNNSNGGDPGMSGIPTTRRGMPPGGAGSMAPADYRGAAPNYQNNGYSQGVTPTMGENYGGMGSDVSAPWNQSGGAGMRNSRAGWQMDYQYQNGGGQTSGRFAPSRQSAQPQNFGAPPMYYGR